MVLINIRLVGEEKDHLFQGIELDSQILYGDLKKEIEITTHIPPRFQHITFRGELQDSLRPLESVKDFEVIVVSHALLANWKTVLELETVFQQTNEKELKKSIHLDAKGLIESLVVSQFFLTYPTLVTRRFAIEKKFLTYFDRKVEEIKKSCRIYFIKMYGNVTISFDSREDGSRSGCICIVNDGFTSIKFYVKTHHGAGDKCSNTRYDLDLKELFVYKFLEQLKIGAEIHFIINESLSKWIIYIGSREIPGFKTLEFVELVEPQNVNEYSKSVVQMLFIFSILMLGDYHVANLGVNGAANPFIVDFFIAGIPMTSVKDLYDNVRMAKEFNAVLGNFDERLIISTDYLKESNFLMILENTLESFLREQKPLFDKSLLVFDKPQKTSDLQDYVENVKKNIKLFISHSPDQ